MIVDSSAPLAVLFAEPDAAVFADAIESAEPRRLSAARWPETAIRIDRGGGPLARAAFDDLVRGAKLAVEPVTREQVKLARTAYSAFGKGSGPPAGLNFGDCFAYALSKVTGESLLFKGGDFSRTDLRPAVVH